MDGTSDSSSMGADDGLLLGRVEKTGLGPSDGSIDGVKDGSSLGADDGQLLGCPEGAGLGKLDGE